VAHSLGAVVARKALLDAFKNTRSWLPTVHLVLFAPAHSGAGLLALATASLSGVDALLATLQFVSALSVLRDLEENGKFLEMLSDQTKAAIAKPGGDVLRARAIAIPPRDLVVNPIDFITEDAGPEVIDGTTHMTVCKPNIDRLEAVAIVRRFL